MKLKKITIALLALVLLAGNSAYAQDETSTTRPGFQGREKVEEMRANYQLRREQVGEAQEKVRADMEARRLEMREKMLAWTASSTERRALIAEKRAEMRQSHINTLVENATKMLTVTSERFDKIIERIESRIEKVKTAGGNTADAEKFVSAAKTDLAEVKSMILNLPKVEVTDADSASAPRNFETLRSAVKIVKEEMRSVHENLKNAVASLKSIERPADAEDSPEESN